MALYSSGGKLVTSGGGIASTGSPLNFPLVQSTTPLLTFLGSFKAPTTFQYGGTAMSVNGSTLYMGGFYFYNSGANSAFGVGSMTIPVLSGAPAYDGSNATATAIVVPTTYTDGSGNPLLDWGGGTAPAGGNAFTGSLIYGGNLYLTGGIGYDAGNLQNSWILLAASNLANSGFGTPNGASAPNAGPRMFSAPIGVVPTIWQSILGGPVYVLGGQGLSVSSSLTAGFGFSTFDPATVSSGGGSVTVTQLQNYYATGTYTSSQPEMLSYRSFSGPFGSGTALTLSGAPTNGATSAAFSSSFQLPLPAEQQVGYGALYQITFSDGETRDVHLTNGSTAIPDSGSFSALTGSSFTTSVTIKPYGDNYVSEYDGPISYGFFVPGSRTFIYIHVHQYGPLCDRGSSPCDPGGSASSNNEAPFSPDTGAYRRLQITAYDVSTSFYQVKQGNQAVYAASPYAWWEFPSWQSLVVGGSSGNCVNDNTANFNGNFYFDPATSRLYGTMYDTYGGGNGNNIVFVWQVTGL